MAQEERKNKMRLDVALAFDENYVQHAAVCIESIILNNLSDFESVNIHILENGISILNKEKLKKIYQDFSAVNVFYYPQVDLEEKVHPIIKNYASISTYSRLLLASLLDKEIEKVIYLDCDGVVLGSLLDLYYLKIDNYYVGGVIDDVIDCFHKERYGLAPEQNYINAGFLLINLKKWRQDGAERKLLNCANTFEEELIYWDQEVINMVFQDEILIIDPKYNLKPTAFLYSWKKRYSIVNKNNYYSKKDLFNAKKEPIYIHFHASPYGRPWESSCLHPKRKAYDDYLLLTPWHDSKKIGRSFSFKEKIKKKIFFLIHYKLAYKNLIKIYGYCGNFFKLLGGKANS